MPYYFIAAGLILHTYFWGMGATWLVLPGRWRRWWWAFAPGLGMALQSAVVWVGAHTLLPGTASYAWWSELLPLILLWVGGRRLGLATIRSLARDFWRPPAVLLVGIMAIAAWFLLSPMAAAGRGVTSSSLGSCDHADYAAGARVFLEFSKDDRVGMLGLSEVTRIGSAEYFFDFWLRLNHFMPSALIAHQSAIFGLEPYRLISVTAVVLLLLNIPLVFFLARAAAGVRVGVALFIAALYAISPLSAYAVHQGGLGQLLAAQGIALLVVITALLFREARRGRPLWPWGLMLFAAFWLLAGSYNFILIVGLAQVVPWVLGRALVKRQTPSIKPVALVMSVALLLCIALFWPRFSGIVERFQLFAEYDYGWRVPLLAWDGWLGLVSDVYLEPLGSSWQPLLMLGLGAGWLGWLWRAWQQERLRAVAAAALVLPVVLGWTILAWASLTRTNASYDAFKLISVFYPGLLAGLGAGLVLSQKNLKSAALGGVMIIVIGFNLIRANEYRQIMARPPLRVNKHIVELGKLEARPEVGSINLKISHYWSRLWADAFLLRTPHYFAESTYEGRNVTPLRGEWDLKYSLLQVFPSSGADYRELGRNFQLVRPLAISALRAEFGLGWYAFEHFVTDQWRWTRGTGQIILTNTQAVPVRARMRLMVQGLHGEDALEVSCNAQLLQAAGISSEASWMEPVDLTLPPGASILTLSPAKNNRQQAGVDPRKLGIGLHRLELHLLPQP